MTSPGYRLNGVNQQVTGFRLDGVNRTASGLHLSPAPVTPPAPLPATIAALPAVPWEGTNAQMWAGNPSAAAMGLTDDGHFPIVTFLGYTEGDYCAQAKAAGITGYFGFVDSTKWSPGLAPQLTQQGMYAWVQYEAGTSDVNGTPVPNLSTYWGTPNSNIVGHFLGDELDMTGGPYWNSPPQNNGQPGGYTSMADHYGLIPAASKTARHAASNFGKGVLMWENEAQAQVFVNGGTNGSLTFTPKVVGFDLYYYSDTNVADEALNWLGIPTKAQVRRAINYGRHGVRRLRQLQYGAGAPLRPIFAHVEAVTQSGYDPSRTNPNTVLPAEYGPDQIQGAVWASIIYGARGISYFGHDALGWGFGAKTIEENTTGHTPAITALNAKVKSLAPVINTQTRAFGVNGGLDTMLKAQGGYAWIFAMQGRSATVSGSYEHALPPGVPANQTVTVVGENRTIAATGGRFTDTYAAEHTCHIYRINLTGSGATVPAGAATPNGTTGGANQSSSAAGEAYIGT